MAVIFFANVVHDVESSLQKTHTHTHIDDAQKTFFPSKSWHEIFLFVSLSLNMYYFMLYHIYSAEAMSVREMLKNNDFE